MIQFNRIAYKNFLSTGNVFTEYKLDTLSKNLLYGKNGSGKSTLLDALTFVLFGKSFRGTNKPNLVNETNNSNCLVEIEFVIGDKEYLVKRGLKPNVFEIYSNSILINQSASSKDYQEHFETNILRLNYKTFTQIVVLGSSTYIPFMRLPLASRREVVEELLDIQIFGRMNNILKSKMLVHKQFVDDLTNQLTVNKSVLATQTTNLTRLLSRDTDKKLELKKEIDVNESVLVTIGDSIKRIISEISEKKLQDNSSKVLENFSKVRQLKFGLTKSSETLKTKKKFFETNRVCITCEQDITESHKSNIIGNLNAKLKEADKSNSLLDQKTKKLEVELESMKELTDQIQSLNDKIIELNAKKQTTEAYLRKIRGEYFEYSEDSNIETLKSEIAQTKHSIDTIEEQRKNATVEYEKMLYTLSILKDTGIKSQIIGQYIPVLNEQIQKNLRVMNFHVTFSLNENFEESVRGMTKDNFLYWNFSEGEKQRIDLAILFAFRTVAAMKNSLNTNLLILDEVFDSSMDTSGTDDLLTIMNDMVKSTVFVISHRTGMEDKFDNVFKISKNAQNFSTVTQER